MNTALKWLAAATLIAVIVAAGTYVVRGVREGGGIGQGGGRSTTEPPKEPRVITESAPAPTSVEPVAVKPDNPLQPSYRPINEPSYIQFLRQEGKTYHTRVVGKVSGQASKKDWGIRGIAYFEYLYAMESSGKIVSNDGVTIVEERSFGKVHENLIPSGYEIRVELPEKLDSLLDLLDWVAPFVGVSPGGGQVGKAVAKIVNHVQVPVRQEWIDAARASGVFRILPEMDPQQLEREIKMFTQGVENRLLEGKTVRIVFKDGYGISEIVPVGCAISDRERYIIVRTNFVIDHYIFPDRKVEPGTDWAVPGDVFAGFLDPRLSGKVGGKITVVRTPDFVAADGKVSKKLRIAEGQVVVREQSGSADVTGQLTGLKGVCVLPDDVGVVTAAHLSGYAEYRNVSRDHLLFEAQTTFTPKCEIRYECFVE